MLIKTKLRPPALRSRMLFREALTSRLCAAKAYPLILISGPAGSGKTSVLCQAINQEKLRVAWYSLDEEDNEPDLFFRYLLTSLSQSDEQLGKALSPLLDHRRNIAGENIIPHIIAPLLTISRDIHLVLDDFHQITNEKIHVALKRLIKYMPDRLHLVLLSRYASPVLLDAVILKKERLELTASDLKFTETETADLYRKVIPCSFSQQQIKELNQYMEGWAAGLQLIGLSVRSKGPVSELSHILGQAHEQMSSYLIHDILRMQPEKIRKFVFATALLDRFNPKLCTEITGRKDAVKILAHLSHMKLFLIPLDTQGSWYRYHHIFSEVIRRQLAIDEPDLICATLKKAASWLAKNNHLEEALRCAFRSNDFEFTADLMEAHIMGFIETFDVSAALRWISKLPQGVLTQRPLLRLQQGSFHSVLFEFFDVKEILFAIENDGKPDFDRYSDETQAYCRDLHAYLKCILHISYAGDVDSIAQFEALRDKIFPQNPLLVGGIETQIVFSLISKGDLVLAESFFGRLTQVPLAKTNQRIRKKIYHAKIRALIAQHRGRLQQAEITLLQVLQYLDEQGYDHSPMTCLLHRQLGSIYYHQNRLEEARECVSTALKYYESEFFGLIDQVMAGNELRMQLYRAAGDYEKALECVRQIQAFSIKLGMPQIAAGADACVARIAIDKNNLTAADLWSKGRNLKPDEPFSLLFAMECLTQARLFYAKGQYSNAAQLLETLRSRCAKRALGELLLKIDILQAATHYAMAQDLSAVSCLKGALAFAETEGYLQPFVNDSKLIAPILRRIADEAPGTLSAAYLKRVFAVCNTPPIGPYKLEYCEYEQLTQREIEILKWMAKGFQNKEIAQKACIAITTVKTHVSNILVKLNVKTRTQAVVKAREMNILEAV